MVESHGDDGSGPGSRRIVGALWPSPRRAWRAAPRTRSLAACAGSARARGRATGAAAGTDSTRCSWTASAPAQRLASVGSAVATWAVGLDPGVVRRGAVGGPGGLRHGRRPAVECRVVDVERGCSTTVATSTDVIRHGDPDPGRRGDRTSSACGRGDRADLGVWRPDAGSRRRPARPAADRAGRRLRPDLADRPRLVDSTADRAGRQPRAARSPAGSGCWTRDRRGARRSATHGSGPWSGSRMTPRRPRRVSRPALPAVRVDVAIGRGPRARRRPAGRRRVVLDDAGRPVVDRRDRPRPRGDRPRRPSAGDPARRPASGSSAPGSASSAARPGSARAPTGRSPSAEPAGRCAQRLDDGRLRRLDEVMP